MMRKVVAVSLFLLLALVLLAGTTSAASKAMSFGFDTPWSAYAATSPTLAVTTGYWIVECTGATTLTATEDMADLTGNFGGKVWEFVYHHPVTGWQTITDLVNGTTAIPVSNKPTSVDISESSGPFTVYADAFAISYSIYLSGDGSAASGTAGLVATVVPEPSSLVAIATGVVGLLGVVSRRKRF